MIFPPNYLWAQWDDRDGHGRASHGCWTRVWLFSLDSKLLDTGVVV